MIFHVSIDADNPRHVAEVIAELWDGQATPFPPVIAGSWVAMAGDERNTIIEVYPRGTELVPADGDADSYGVIGSPNRRSATHVAIATHMGATEVFAIAEREGWPAKYSKRGGAFGVIEFWVEGSRMIEVLTPVMQGEYLGAMTLGNWNAMLASAVVGQRQPEMALIFLLFIYDEEEEGDQLPGLFRTNFSSRQRAGRRSALVMEACPDRRPTGPRTA